jgi:hypothetical protein
MSIRFRIISKRVADSASPSGGYRGGQKQSGWVKAVASTLDDFYRSGRFDSAGNWMAPWTLRLVKVNADSTSAMH